MPAIIAKRNNLRVIGGKWRSRKISFPTIEGLRPTGDRIRETLFNWLQLEIPGACCLDLFAGSGACGIEALSRGARKVLFIEQDRKAASAIDANLKTLDCKDGLVINAEALGWLESYNETNGEKFDIVFIDPPYRLVLAEKAAQRLEQSGCLKPAARIYLESDQPLYTGSMPGNWRELKHKKAGAVHYYLFGRDNQDKQAIHAT